MTVMDANLQFMVLLFYQQFLDFFYRSRGNLKYF